MSQSIGMVSLGCAKNQVDAEQMLFLLQQAGFEIHAEPAGSDVVIINTCGFIESAKTEAIDNILAMAALKAEGSIGKILVTGCLAQRYQQEILKELPEVDGVLGTGSYYDVVGAVKQLLAGREGLEEYGDIQAPVQECGRILTTPRQYAYLKIAEGCDNHCAFCIIPALRGRYRSRPMEKLIEEAKELAAGGAKELIVVAQDTSRYGIDLYGERKLAERLRPGYLRPRTLPAAGPSILHFGEPGAPDEPATPPAPVPAVRQEALPTRTLPREDPPIGEAAQTRNRLAYERDARRLAER